MSPELRTQIAIGRSSNYFDIMRTVMFGFVAVAAIIEFGVDGYSPLLAMIVVALAAYGILAGGAAMDDLSALREDLDEETRASAYGRVLAARNFTAFKGISAVLIGLTGLAELYVLFT